MMTRHGWGGLSKQERTDLLMQFINLYQRLYGYAPTNRHLALMFDVHEVTMHHWMMELQDLGRIRRGETRRALIEVTASSVRVG